MSTDPVTTRFFLIGFMGVGKTTIGRDLASRLGMPFYDLDNMIEKTTGKRIQEIFSEGGEEAFRAIETEVLKQIVDEGSGVIATGGGTFTRSENREIIRSAGTSIWLDAPPGQIIERGASGGDRPLWRGRARAQSLLAARLPHYRQADLRFDLSGAPPEEAAAQLARLLASRNLK